MSENIVGHVQGFQKELRKLTNECPKDGEDRHVICIEEFRDEFNPHANDTTNKSANLYTQSILPVRNAVYSSHHTHHVGCGKRVNTT